MKGVSHVDTVPQYAHNAPTLIRIRERFEHDVSGLRTHSDEIRWEQTVTAAEIACGAKPRCARRRCQSPGDKCAPCENFVRRAFIVPAEDGVESTEPSRSSASAIARSLRSRVDITWGGS